MIDEPDDTLSGYVPGGKRKARMTISAENDGIVASVWVDGPQTPPQEPTRYAVALRRQASNRARAKAGQQSLPAITAGTCARCEGWGVLGKSRQRCAECGGSGG